MKTSEEITYEKLRELIIEGEFPVGEFLSQRMLAKRTGAVVITVRESLRRLENDGLIENIPKWGARIPVETETTVKERYYLRELLEVGAVERMLDLNVPGAAETLMAKAVICDAVTLVDSDSYRDFAAKHADLHLEIARLSGNSMLLQTLERLKFRGMMLSNSKRAWEARDERLIASHHQDYVRELFSGDRDQAARATRAHVRRGLTMELKTLNMSALASSN